MMATKPDFEQFTENEILSLPKGIKLIDLSNLTSRAIQY